MDDPDNYEKKFLKELKGRKESSDIKDYINNNVMKVKENQLCIIANTYLVCERYRQEEGIPSKKAKKME